MVMMTDDCLEKKYWSEQERERERERERIEWSVDSAEDSMLDVVG